MLKPGQTIQTWPDCIGKVWLDQSLVRKMLVNLLSNAIKYSGENKPIRVRFWCRDGRVRLSIEDQGIGMSADDQKHLFERFYRAKNVTAIQGTGLGLHIVAQYLTLLNGTIDFQSQLNQGTTVTISFSHEDDSAH